MIDIIIIGSGITGSFIAHNLSKYNVKVLLLEKEIELGSGITKANSAIIHSGFNPKPGTLKAKLNALANKLFGDIAQELNVAFKRIGSYTLAFTDEEEVILKRLHQQGIENGVKTNLVNRDELSAKEPNINPSVRCGLYSPSTGIIAPWEMVYALLENAVFNGAQVKRNHEVLNIEKKPDYFVVKTNQTTFKSRYVINASGLHAYEISRMVTEDPGYKMIYTRGQYYVLDKGYEDFVNHVIYPTPTDKGKGVLVVPTIHGNVLLGPTSEKVNCLGVTKEGLSYVKEHINKMMRNVPYEGIIRSFSGIRPKTDRRDFIIEELKDVPGFIQVAGIDSPGLASSPAIAKMVENILLNKETFSYKSNYSVYRQKAKGIHTLPEEKINEFIQNNHKYGKIICRCEKVTEGEIIDAIHSPLGAKTLDDVKRRVKAGFGRCQGGFCQPLIVSILARELGIDKTKVLLNQLGSNILVEETKTNGGATCERS